ncbi:MAG UNVERIFIED_CONTAM: hypothetical protein LVQ98_08350 [Rickettsiaceae bacterium]|jgi:hypothetical protein
MHYLISVAPHTSSVTIEEEEESETAVDKTNEELLAEFRVPFADLPRAQAVDDNLGVGDEVDEDDDPSASASGFSTGPYPAADSLGESPTNTLDAEWA